jgi:CheY-like chemotaxis protein
MSRHLDVDVLIVDDSHDVRTSFASVLRVAGYRVAEAEDGFVALELVKETRVGVMLLDLRMPVLDRFGVLDKLDDPLPVVVITGYELGSELRGHEPNIFAYMRKPVSGPDLLGMVGRALEKKS